MLHSLRLLESGEVQRCGILQFTARKPNCSNLCVSSLESSFEGLILPFLFFVA